MITGLSQGICVIQNSLNVEVVLMFWYVETDVAMCCDRQDMHKAGFTTPETKNKVLVQLFFWYLYFLDSGDIWVLQ